MNNGRLHTGSHPLTETTCDDRHCWCSGGPRTTRYMPEVEQFYSASTGETLTVINGQPTPRERAAWFRSHPDLVRLKA